MKAFIYVYTGKQSKVLTAVINVLQILLFIYFFFKIIVIGVFYFLLLFFLERLPCKQTALSPGINGVSPYDFRHG